MQDAATEDIVIKATPKGLQGVHNIRDLIKADMYRGTYYRGVSKNGKLNWQILTMVEGKKVYLCTLDNIHKAAMVYDIFQIQTRGIKCKTNFNYTKAEAMAVLKCESLLHLKDTREA